jgi:hypothetical protein
MSTFLIVFGGMLLGYACYQLGKSSASRGATRRDNFPTPEEFMAKHQHFVDKRNELQERGFKALAARDTAAFAQVCRELSDLSKEIKKATKELGA